MTHIKIEKEKIKLALEALALRYKSEWQDFERFADVIAALEEALASEQEQRNVSEQLGEPVGEMQFSAIYEGMVVPVVPVELPAGTKLYTTPQPAPQGEARGLSQQKPLTDEQIEHIRQQPQHHKGEFDYTFDEVSFARAIEAAHGIKENT